MVAVAEQTLAAASPVASPLPAGATLIDFYLQEQQSLSAVERFSQQHALELDEPRQSQYYAALLPAAPPRPGEQYAFEVDLDACSGCKACVTACHSLNGLDEQETWRDVGMLHGGSQVDPFMQHVTAACHHCLDPACLNVCPVRAYEKDDATGIVRHLDDQCIGCQYCILACPYDVPKYNSARGIVRKCDLCSQRLEKSEAPACVQACPNSAIRVTVVRQHDVVEYCESGAFLPGAPDPQITQPTTNYRTNRVFPRNALPADFYAVRPEHAHWPLILMLVLTQLSVGTFLVEVGLQLAGGGGLPDLVRGWHAASALVCGMLALGASTLHLGRPLYAFRAVLGLRTSWLSREIVAFGAFAVFAALYAAVILWDRVTPGWLREHEGYLGLAVVLTGFAGVICSIRIYQQTRRALWTGSGTAMRFLLTMLVLGSAASLVLMLATATTPGAASAIVLVDRAARGLVQIWIGLSVAKLAYEAAIFLHLGDRQQTPLKRSALLMTGELRSITIWRFVLGSLGGLAFPAALLSIDALEGSAALWRAAFVALAGFLCLLAGEFCERFLFFTAVAAPRMPGALRT